jgi:hypothetical protein
MVLNHIKSQIMKLLSVFFSMLIICLSVGVSARNGPVVKLGTVKTTASTATVPITVDDFTNIKSFDLKIKYEASVATPITITKGAELKGALSFNLNVPGVIKLIWNAPTASVCSLNSGDTLFNITFNSLESGTSVLFFDESANLNDCQFYDSDYTGLNDVPGENYFIPGSLTFTSQVSPVITAPVITDCSNPDINVSLTITDFKNIGAVSLTLKYDPLVLSFNSATNSANFPGLQISGNVAGDIKIGGFTIDPDGFSLADGMVLFTLNFTYLGGATNLNWFDDGVSCEFNSVYPEYNKLDDTPQANFYINGFIGTVQAPAPEIVVGEIINPVSCNGNGTIPITFTNVPDGIYTISYDGGSFPNVAVSANAALIEASTGAYNDLQITVNGETSVLGVNVVLSNPASPEQPVISAGGPNTFCEGGSVVLTSNEALTYKWSTRETTQSITVSASGNYSVTVTNAAGCSSISEITVVTVNAKPEKPAKVNCWDDYRFNTTLCVWENKGTEPLKPEKVNCWDNFQFSETLCAWENKGTEPVKPESVNCWDEFVFNSITCVWDNTGTKSVKPTPVNCWDEFTFNTNTCVWENSGVQPAKPAMVNCWDDFQFSETLCAWENKGSEPLKPEKVNCWDNFIFNNTTCAWGNSGTQPTEPTPVNCWDKFNFNTNSCSWENIGVKPEKPAMVNCWDDYQFNIFLCVWENNGTQPVKPAQLKSWDEFIFNPKSCAWENIGVATDVEIYRHDVEMTLTCYPNPFNANATIKYLLPEDGRVSMEVTGILGNRISLLSNRQQAAGEYLQDLEGGNLAQGIYQITLRLSDHHGGDLTKTIRMIKQ